MDYCSGRSFGCRMRQFKFRGFDCLAMENDVILLTIIIDKGADIYNFVYKPRDIDFLWKSPTGLREKVNLIPSINQGIGSYFDYYEGGWQEILPGGGPANFSGADIGLHGEVNLLPWEFTVEKDTAEEITVRFSARTLRSPFSILKRITLSKGCQTVSFEEALTNEGRQELEFLWAQHPSFGPPFLDENCTLFIPAKKVMASPSYHSENAIMAPGAEASWPHTIPVYGDMRNVPAPEAQITGLYHFSELDEAWYAIVNSNLELGFGMNWDKEVFPYITSWQDFNGSMNYPWYGRANNMTLEFWNSITDNYETAKQFGKIAAIHPGETVSTSFKATVFEGKTVTRINSDGSVEY